MPIKRSDGKMMLTWKDLIEEASSLPENLLNEQVIVHFDIDKEDLIETAKRLADRIKDGSSPKEQVFGFCSQVTGFIIMNLDEEACCPGLANSTGSRGSLQLRVTMQQPKPKLRLCKQEQMDQHGEGGE